MFNYRKNGIGIITHNMSRTKQYFVWQSMMRRCENKNHKQYPEYGGRGIKVCEKWKTFEGFWEDMCKEYKEGLSLERINNNKGYYKNNCKWAIYLEQANNKRNNVKYEYNGQILTIPQWARKYSLPIYTLKARIRNKWLLEKALTTPVDKRFSSNKGKRFLEIMDGKKL